MNPTGRPRPVGLGGTPRPDCRRAVLGSTPAPAYNPALMKAILFTDTHANLPALNAFLQFTKWEGYDLLVHLGDVVAIGPHPAECLETLLSLDRLLCLTGNHDDWLANGLPSPQPAWMSDGEVAHQAWTHAQIAPEMVAEVAKWPWRLDLTMADVRVLLMHYPLGAEPRSLKAIETSVTESALDTLFAGEASPLIFYGHHHPHVDVVGRSHYINPGSLGCHTQAVSRCTILVCEKGQYTIRHEAIPYDDSTLWADFERRKVPERHLLNQYFYGGRLH